MYCDACVGKQADYASVPITLYIYYLFCLVINLLIVEIYFCICSWRNCQGSREVKFKMKIKVQCIYVLWWLQGNFSRGGGATRRPENLGISLIVIPGEIVKWGVQVELPDHFLFKILDSPLSTPMLWHTSE